MPPTRVLNDAKRLAKPVMLRSMSFATKHLNFRSAAESNYVRSRNSEAYLVIN
jgi:hypothetical protein